MEKFFKLKEKGTNVRTEIVAGLTTFMTMAYVLVVQPGAIVGFGPDPSITDVNGVVISKSAILIMCALISGLITLFMGFYTNLPFALSTGMGVNFVLGGLIQSQDISFGRAMAIVLITGVIFLALTIFGIRDLIVRMIPKNIKLAIGATIGFFIAYLGFKNTGIGVFSERGISRGDFTSPPVYLAILGVILIAVLTAFRIKGALLIGIVVVTVLGIPLSVTKLPEQFFAVPSFNDVDSIIFNFDFSGMLAKDTLVLMFIAFFGDFFSTLGTVLGLAGKADMLDENGDMPGIEKPFLVDAVGTCAGACGGCTVVTTYVESSAGVEAGGRSGLTAITTAVLFLISILFAPLFLVIPNAATGAALIFVGFIMMGGISKIDFSNFSDAFGPFTMIMFCIFTGSIAGGISAGILADVFIKTLSGKYKEVHPAMYVLCVPLIAYFVL